MTTATVFRKGNNTEEVVQEIVIETETGEIEVEWTSRGRGGYKGRQQTPGRSERGQSRSQSRERVSESDRAGIAGDSCHRCGQPGHWARECRNCYNCGSSQHFKKDFFKLKQADVEMVTHLPRSTLAIMGMTKRSQTKTHALYTTFLLQGKLTTALVDSGSSISLISWSYLQTLTFSGKTEEYNGKILTANNSPLLIKGKVELIVQLQKFTPEFRATF